LFNIPQDARLVSEGGNAKTGYMRLEAEKCFFEVKWEEVEPKKAKPLSEIVHAFLKKMEKDSKQKIPIRSKRSATVFDHQALFMSLKSNIEERIFFWHCSETLRVIIFRFAFQSMDTTSRAIMKEVLTSFKCHGEESTVWSLFEFTFKAPTSFQLSDRKMMIGRTHLLLLEHKLSPFAERKREILFDYYSMANVQFRDEHQDLDKWFEKRYRKDLRKRYRGSKFQSSTVGKINGHGGIVKKGLGRTGIITRKSSLYNYATWYCEDLNRIYSVTISEHLARPFPLKRRLDQTAFEDFCREFISNLRCH